MRITVLGCGASAGVPLIGCDCAVCMSGDPRNHRTRASILVEEGNRRILVDTSPDLRHQCLANDISSVDAVLYTHAHADHTHGIDDVRSFNYLRNGPLDCYGDAATLQSLQSRFSYAFLPPPQSGWYRPCLLPIAIEPAQEMEIAGIHVQCLEQLHGKMLSLGFRFGDFAYSTDVNHLPEASFAALEGVQVWLIDCLRFQPAPTHAHLAMTLEWIERVQPERAILTHMSHDFDYEAIRGQLPEYVEPAYDGMIIEL